MRSTADILKEIDEGLSRRFVRTSSARLVYSEFYLGGAEIELWVVADVPLSDRPFVFPRAHILQLAHQLTTEEIVDRFIQDAIDFFTFFPALPVDDNIVLGSN